MMVSLVAEVCLVDALVRRDPDPSRAEPETTGTVITRPPRRTSGSTTPPKNLADHSDMPGSRRSSVRANYGWNPRFGPRNPIASLVQWYAWSSKMDIDAKPERCAAGHSVTMCGKMQIGFLTFIGHDELVVTANVKGTSLARSNGER